MEVCCGILVEGEPIPLEGVSVEATIKDFCSRVTLTQRYRNQEAKPVEAVYVFPLEDGAAVCGFEALIDDVHVVGEDQEREKAFETYDEALAQGHGAYLLDQEKPDVFTASIGNIPPGKEVLVKVTYVAELTLEGDDIRFALPTTVSPRYAPAKDQIGIGRSPAEVVNPPVEWRVPYGLELTVRLEMPSAIRGVESPSHPISAEIDDRKGTIKLGGRETTLDRDFVLLVRLAKDQEPRAWVEKGEEGGMAAMLAFQPEFEEEEAPSEMIFVIDRSGSMDGTSIAEARNALQLCLRSLPEGTRFNVVGFGSRFKMLFPESELYSEASLREASDKVKEMRADLGGTEILSPLKAILEKKPNPELPRQLFVLTDGQVTNTQHVISLIRRHSDTTRVFSFGIGAGASHHLVRGMARAGGGTAEFIYPGERIEKKVLRQLKKALAPGLTDVKVDWGRLKVKQAPYNVPPVFAGGRVLVYGLLEAAPSEKTEVTLTAKSPDGPLSFKLPVHWDRAAADKLIGTLAARTMIRDLEEGSSALHRGGGSKQNRKSKDRVRDEIVRLGVAYGLCSRETSFVAVELRDAVPGEIQLRRVPTALTWGWGGTEQVLGGSAQGRFRRVGPGAARLAVAPAAFAGGPPEVLYDVVEGAAMEMDVGEPAGAGHDEELVLETTSQPVRPLDKLVAVQRADGSWDLTEELGGIVGKSLPDLEGSLDDAEGDRDEARRALATSLALVWLQTEASEWKDEWTLLERKARKWLGKCAAKLAGGRDWLEAAEAVLSQP
jgi:Ca-activated chloride channel family protein